MIILFNTINLTGTTISITARFFTYQYSRGHITRRASALQIIRQLQLQRTYLLPGGGGRTGYSKHNPNNDCLKKTSIHHL